MKNKTVKLIISLICCILIIFAHYGFFMRHIFWDSTLFGAVEIPQSVSFQIYEEAKLYYPWVDSYGNLTVWKPSSNQWSRDFRCRYLSDTKEILIDTPEMFIDLSNSTVAKTSDPQRSKLSETELIELLSEYARSGKKIDESKYSIETVWLGRECYEVIHIDEDISGDLITYSSGAGTEKRMPAIPAKWTNYEDVHFQRMLSQNELLIAAGIAILYIIAAVVMLHWKAERLFWIVSLLFMIESIIIVFVGIYNR